MDRVLLRTLALKSTLNFGKYQDYSVQQVLDQNPIDGIKYLIWVYYNSSNISFNDEILKILGISEDMKIEKPGKITKAEFYNYTKEARKNRGAWSEKEKNILLGNYNMSKKQSKGRNNHFLIKQTDRGILQRKNHGH